ncbi:MAG: DUF2007 domain-containing protein [Ruminiclostridium sp.]|nr:DUF2007 domain-containing protein [Ruminiclostridium sp.]
MFCPKCKCEYKDGLTTCPDCDVSLADLPGETREKPPKVKYGHTDYELVFTTFVYSEIALLKSVFDSEGIVYFIQGEDLGVAPGGLQARVFVSKEQAEESKQLLKEFNLL